MRLRRKKYIKEIKGPISSRILGGAKTAGRRVKKVDFAKHYRGFQEKSAKISKAGGGMVEALGFAGKKTAANAQAPLMGSKYIKEIKE